MLTANPVGRPRKESTETQKHMAQLGQQTLIPHTDLDDCYAVPGGTFITKTALLKLARRIGFPLIFIPYDFQGA